MRAPVAGHRLGDARGAGDQCRAAVQEFGDLRQRLRIARQQERESRFRPDQMGDVGDAGRGRRGRAIRQREIAPHDRVFVLRRETGVLRDIGLHDAQLHAGDRRRIGRRQAKRAESGEQPPSAASASTIGRAEPAPASLIGQSRRRGENSDGENRQAMQSRRSRRIAQERRFWPSAMPISFQGNPVSTSARSPSLAPRPTASAKMRPAPGDHNNRAMRKAERGEKSEAGGERQNAQRKRPGEFVGLDEKGGAEPPEARDEIAKAPPPARCEGRSHRSDRSNARARRPPADPSISQTAVIIGASIAGRKSNGGRARAPMAPGAEGDRAPPPVPGENNALGDRADKIPFAGLPQIG